MTRHILEGHCPQGINTLAKMVEFLKEIGWVLGILKRPGEADERVLDRLRGMVQRVLAPYNMSLGRGSERQRMILIVTWVCLRCRKKTLLGLSGNQLFIRVC
jgi:hypothetical protein